MVDFGYATFQLCKHEPTHYTVDLAAMTICQLKLHFHLKFKKENTIDTLQLKQAPPRVCELTFDK